MLYDILIYDVVYLFKLDVIVRYIYIYILVFV